MKQGFEDIKVGDMVLFPTDHWHNTTIIAKVTRVTPKQFEAHGNRFRKRDGAMIGNHYRHCKYASDEDIKRYKAEQYRISLRQKAMRFFQSYDNINSLTTEELETIANILANKTVK